MNKPLTIARQEFAQALVELINNSGLPAFIMSDLVNQAKTELDKLANAQYEADVKAWEEANTDNKED